MTNNKGWVRSEAQQVVFFQRFNDSLNVLMLTKRTSDMLTSCTLSWSCSGFGRSIRLMMFCFILIASRTNETRWIPFESWFCFGILKDKCFISSINISPCKEKVNFHMKHSTTRASAASQTQHQIVVSQSIYLKFKDKINNMIANAYYLMHAGWGVWGFCCVAVHILFSCIFLSYFE